MIPFLYVNVAEYSRTQLGLPYLSCATHTSNSQQHPPSISFYCHRPQPCKPSQFNNQEPLWCPLDETDVVNGRERSPDVGEHQLLTRDAPKRPGRTNSHRALCKKFCTENDLFKLLIDILVCWLICKDNFTRIASYSCQNTFGIVSINEDIYG